jgi:hypothetical protein
VATTVNKAEALLPRLGLEWIPVLLPVVADYWRQKLGAAPKAGQEEETESRYERLKKTLEKTFPTARLKHRWSGQVLETPDGLP